MSSNYIGSTSEAMAVLNSIHARDRLIVAMLEDIGTLRDALNHLAGGSEDAWVVRTANVALRVGNTHIKHLPPMSGNTNNVEQSND